MGQTERVILIKGDHTKWYNQAIFIINQDTPAGKMPVDFVAEAEKIINSYMSREKKAAAVKGGFTKVAATPSGGGSYSYPPTSGNTLTARPAQPITRVAARPAKKRASKFDMFLNFIMVLACVAIIAVIIYGLMV